MAGLLRRFRHLPVPAQIAIIYGAGRLVTLLFLVLAAAMSVPGSRFGLDPTIGNFAVGWDAEWYWRVAEYGYPTSLPVDSATGQVGQNAWAFMPIYAWVSAAIGFPFGSWGAGAVIVSLVAGYGACLALYRLLAHHLPRKVSLWAVVFFAWGPISGMFQVGYAESLFLCLLFFALERVSARKYGWVYPLIVLMAFTRPGVLAFSLFLALFGIWRWFRRRVDPLPTVEIVHIVALGLLGVVTGFAWQFIAAAVTGIPDAYIQTELSWRQDWTREAGPDFFPGEGWVQAAKVWFGVWGFQQWVGVVALVILIIGVVCAFIFSKRVKQLSMEVRLWSISYLVYLLAVFFPQTSIFRLLLPLAPAAAIFAMRPSSRWRWMFLGVCVLLQWWWIYNMYAQAQTYWQIP